MEVDQMVATNVYLDDLSDLSVFAASPSAACRPSRQQFIKSPNEGRLRMVTSGGEQVSLISLRNRNNR